MLAAMGTGPLYQAVLRINAQLGDLQRSARAVIVRVAMGKNPDGTENVAQTIANIIGDPGQKTGLYALFRAPGLLGTTPRILGAPGYTGIVSYAATAPVVTIEGTGYSHPVAVFNPPGAAAALTIDANGAITGATLTSPGNYPPGTIVTATISDSQGGTGHGAAMAVSLEILANPICAALPAICNALLAHAVVGGPGTTKADAVAWRGTLNDQRLIPVDNWEIIAGGTSDGYVDGAAATMGCAVRTDYQHGGYPFWSWGNQPVQGLLGLKRIDELSLLDGATDGQELLAIGVGITDRGSLDDGSLDDSGFILCCFNNASSDPRYSMFNKTRGRDFTNLAIIRSVRRRLMKDNITIHSIQAVLNDMTAIMSDLRARECVVGFKIGFAVDSNTPDNLRLGKIRVFDDSEEPAPILQVTVDRALDTNALTAELALIAAGTSQVVG